MTNRLMRLLIVITLLSTLGPLGPSNALAQNDPANGERYLIILKPQKNGVPDFTDRDVTAVGGRVDFKAAGRVDVTLPASAVDALRKHARVKYIQKAVMGPPPPPAAASVVRLKPTALSLHPKLDATPPTWLSGTYLYDTSGNIYAIGVADDTGAPPQHRYAYDNLSRLTTANTTAVLQPNETFAYDDYGNMTSHQVGSNTTTMSVVTATNRFTTGGTSPYQYDELGNLTADAEATYAYDPFSMLREKDYQYKMPEFYIYTASDERIGVKYGSLSDSVTTWSIRDFSGNVLRQFKGMDDQVFATWLWVEDYIYRDGQLVGAERVPEEGGRRHFHLDHLGSPRLVTSSDQTSSNEMSEHDFAPFGMEINPLWQESVGGFDREDPKRFTGHERDYASDGQLQTTKYLDYMHARYYSPGVDRFLSVDPVLGNQRSSQSWNRYSYASNNPVRNIDPNGLCTFTLTGGSLYTDDSIICPQVDAKNPSDLEHAMTMANIEAVENLHYSGMFLDWVARDLASPFLMFGQAVLMDRPLPAAVGVVGSAAIAFGGVAGPETEGELLLLNKSLASESQMAEAAAGGGRAIAGEGTAAVLRDEERLVALYGPGRWAKMTSQPYRASDGHIIETHFYKNLSTGQMVEFKSTLPWH